MWVPPAPAVRPPMARRAPREWPRRAALLAPWLRLAPARARQADWRQFPPDFVWGVSTAAFQVEGGLRETGRGPSIWDTFSQQAGNIENGDTAEVACDHLHRFREDLKLVRQLGAKAYRFSISWSRVLPTGRLSGGVSEEGLAFYVELCRAAVAEGLEPVATLYHWDLPQALEDEGGWLSPGVVRHFADYAELCFRALGSYVRLGGEV